MLYNVAQTIRHGSAAVPDATVPPGAVPVAGGR